MEWLEWHGNTQPTWWMVCPSAVCGRFINNTIIYLVWFGSVWHDVCVCLSYFGTPFLPILITYFIYLYDWMRRQNTAEYHIPGGGGGTINCPPPPIPTRLSKKGGQRRRQTLKLDTACIAYQTLWFACFIFFLFFSFHFFPNHY
jgi:hypothetical protein